MYPMIDLRFVPLEKWPGEPTPEHKKKEGRFRATYAQTLDLLEYELGMLKAKHIAVEAYFSRDQIRNDGWPLSKANPSKSGVIRSFTGKTGELSFPCDTYRTFDDNLRAIGLAMEALRAVDRYGVTQHSQQYKGWAKLPPAPGTMKANDALTFLALCSAIPVVDADSFVRAYREGAKKLHPDNQHTGNAGQFHLLQQAKEALEREFGWK
jgi:hypothetical protein